MTEQFQKDLEVPVTYQDFPGKEGKMPNDPEPLFDRVPDGAGGSKLYQAAGKLKDKKAVITGGDSGIGRATAILFAMEGADSFISYLPDEEDDAQETKRRVEACGRKCYLHPTDVTKLDNVKKMIDDALQQLGGIDILFNNAAFQMMVTDIKDLPEDQWHRTFDTNIHPLYYASKYALPHMKAGSTVINNASINAYIGRPDLLDYTATKGAVVSFTRGLSNQYVGRGIRVNAVAPGPVWTPLIPATMNKEAQKNFTAPMGRPSQPSETATCVVFLASTDSASISGQTIHCNGGVIVNG